MLDIQIKHGLNCQGCVLQIQQKPLLSAQASVLGHLCHLQTYQQQTLSCVSLHFFTVVVVSLSCLKVDCSRPHSHRKQLLSVVIAAEIKQAVTAFLVTECGGQLKRPFPIRASDQSDDKYNTRLQHWLYEKARSVTVFGVQSLVYSSLL